MILVRSGSLRLYMMSEEGKEVTLYRLHEGELCVLASFCVLSSVTSNVIMLAGHSFAHLLHPTHSLDFLFMVP